MRFIVSLLMSYKDEMQRKRNTKQLSKTNDLFISLVCLSYVLFLWKYWPQSGCKYASFFNIFSL